MTGTRAFALLSFFSIACRQDPEDSADSSITGPEDTADTADEGSTCKIHEDTVWSGEVLLDCVWYVDPGVTLTIEAGSTLLMMPSGGLIVDGVLDLNGAEGSPVTFRNNYSISSANYGVNVGGSGDASDLDWSVFEGVGLRLEGGAADGIANAVFSDATLEVLSRDTGFTVDSSTFQDNERDNQSYVVGRELPVLTVQNSTFEFGYVGVQYDGVQGEAHLDVVGSTFSKMRHAVLVGSIGDYDHSATLSDVSVDQTTSYGLYFLQTAATLSNVSVTNSNSIGIYGDNRSALTLNSVSVSDAASTCVYVAGTTTADGLTVERCQGQGVYGGRYGVDIRNAVVNDVESYGIYANGPLSVADTQISYTDSVALYGYNGAVTVSGVSIDHSLSYGIYANQGDLSANNVSIRETDSVGMYSNNGDILLSDSSITGVRSHAVYAYRGDLTVEAGTTGVQITDIEGVGLYAADGNLTAANVALQDVRTYGVYAYYGNIDLTDATLDTIYNVGVYANRGNLTVYPTAGQVTLSNIESHGLYVYQGNLQATNVSVSNTLAYGMIVQYGDVTVSGCTVDNAFSHGIYGLDGTMTVTDTTVTNVLYAGVHNYIGDATVSNVTVDTAGTQGIYVYQGTANLSDVVVNNVVSHGIYTYKGDLNLSQATVSTGEAAGVYVYQGDTTIDSVVINDVRSQGVYAFGDATSIQNLTVSGAGAQGVYAYQTQLTLSDASIEDTDGAGLYIYQGDATIDRVDLSEIGAQGMYVYQGDADVDTMTVMEAVNQGLYVYSGDLLATDVEIANVGDRGVYVYQGDADITNITITDESTGQDQQSAGSHGIDVVGHATVENCLVEKAFYYGLQAKSADVSQCTFSYNNRGVYIYDNIASTISASEITYNEDYGIVGVTSGSNLVDVLGCNITDNDDYGVYYARNVSGNYIANNYTGSGADTTSSGSLDGTLDAKSTQMYYVDAVSSPQSSALTGVGYQP